MYHIDEILIDNFYFSIFEFLILCSYLIFMNNLLCLFINDQIYITLQLF